MPRTASDRNDEKRKAKAKSQFLGEIAAVAKMDRWDVHRLIPRHLSKAPSWMKSDRDIVMAAVKRNGLALEHASAELKADRGIVMATVKQNGWALKHASDGLKANRDIVMMAVKGHGDALEYASNELKADRDVVIAAVQTSGEEAWHCASDEMQADPDVVVEVLEQHEDDLLGLNTAPRCMVDRLLKKVAEAGEVEKQNKLLKESVEMQAKQIQELNVALASSRPIESVDLTQEENEEDLKKPSKRARIDEESDRPKSSLAMLSEMVKIKEEAAERADVAEKEKVEAEAKSEACILIKKEAIEKAAVTEKEKEAALVKLECPICHDVQEETVAFVSCGHVMCVDCADIYAPVTCPTCRVHIESRLRLYK